MKAKKFFVRLAKILFLIVVICCFLLLFVHKRLYYYWLRLTSNRATSNSLAILDKNGFSVYPIPLINPILYAVGRSQPPRWLCRQDMIGKKINIDDVRQAIAVLQPVSFIWRSDKTFDDKGMEVIRDCVSLEKVIVNNTSVTDASADILAGLPKLIFLELGETQVTAKTVQIIADSPWGEGMMITINRFDDTELSDEVRERLERKDIYLNFVNKNYTRPRPPNSCGIDDAGMNAD